MTSGTSRRVIIAANFGGKISSLVPEDGFEPSRGQAPRDFKSLVSTHSTTQAKVPFPELLLCPG